jgi:hypothetical protein
MKEKTMYVVGKELADETWHFQGIYTTEGKAKKNCLDKSYFYVPIILNKVYDTSTKNSWPQAFFPEVK